jgi:hypothetical protein
MWDEIANALWGCCRRAINTEEPPAPPVVFNQITVEARHRRHHHPRLERRNGCSSLSDLASPTREEIDTILKSSSPLHDPKLFPHNNLGL